jgi:hypothetical protein
MDEQQQKNSDDHLVDWLKRIQSFYSLNPKLKKYLWIASSPIEMVFAFLSVVTLVVLFPVVIIDSLLSMNKKIEDNDNNNDKKKL